jgi:hypothetical protein
MKRVLIAVIGFISCFLETMADIARKIKGDRNG